MSREDGEGRWTEEMGREKHTEGALVIQRNGRKEDCRLLEQEVGEKKIAKNALCYFSCFDR